MPRILRVAAVQSAFSSVLSDNLDRMEAAIVACAKEGADIVLLPELFEGPYFPQGQDEGDFALAREAASHPTLTRFSKLAKSLGVALPLSFYERSGPELYNSLAFVNSEGETLGIYRKSHIPDGPGYQEKFFFRPGDTGFRVFPVKEALVGVGICWDQWFPEAARKMALLGAEVLFYPTAIGSEPQDSELDTKDPWQRVMQGHAVANGVGVVAANRVGREQDIHFYGSSFICDVRGDLVQNFSREESGHLLHSFDLDAMQKHRDAFGFFRDRRPEFY